jgi:hypothetical protein
MTCRSCVCRNITASRRGNREVSRFVRCFNNAHLNSGAGVAQLLQRLSYWLDDQGIGVRFPAGARDFSHLHSVSTGSEAHPAS